MSTPLKTNTKSEFKSSCSEDYENPNNKKFYAKNQENFDRSSACYQNFNSSFNESTGSRQSYSVLSCGSNFSSPNFQNPKTTTPYQGTVNRNLSCYQSYQSPVQENSSLQSTRNLSYGSNHSSPVTQTKRKIDWDSKTEATADTEAIATSINDENPDISPQTYVIFLVSN